MKMNRNPLVNEAYVFEYMIHFGAWENRAVHRSTLVSALNLSRSTIYDSLVRLELKGIVRRFKMASKGRGRPLVLWQLTSPEF